MTQPSRRILLVEDEPGLVLTLTDRLRRHGFEVLTADNGYAAERALRDGRFDLVILDVMLPGRDGFEVCRRLRKKDAHTPVLMLTARGAVEDRVRGLELGADDYLLKPFEVRELLARIEALLRRAPQGDRQTRIGKAAVDFDAGTIQIDGEQIEVSALLMRLLECLVHNAGRILTREQLLREVWGHDAMPTTRTVDVHIARLRQCLEENPKAPRHIVTVHAVGYRFDV